MDEDKQYMFVVTACDGRHEHKACDTYAEALQDAANWHGVTPAQLEGGLLRWEGMDGQVTGIEVVGEYDAFMKAEFGDDDA